MNATRKNSNGVLRCVFRDNVRARRKELGLTQRKAAQRIGIAQPTWSLIEANRTAPSLEIVERVARALRTTPDRLLVRDAFTNGKPKKTA